MQSPSTVVRYRLLAQDRENRLIVNILGEETCFLVRASDIVSDPHLLEGFVPKEIARIGYIAGTLSDRDSETRGKCFW